MVDFLSQFQCVKMVSHKDPDSGIVEVLNKLKPKKEEENFANNIFN